MHKLGAWVTTWHCSKHNQTWSSIYHRPFCSRGKKHKGVVLWKKRYLTDDEVRVIAIEKELVDINAEFAHMDANYSGCDWCCGGGDEKHVELTSDKFRLTAEKEALLTSIKKA